MVVSKLTANDKAALHEAAALVKGVMDRHPLEMKATIIVVHQKLLRDLDVIEHLFEEEAA